MKTYEIQIERTEYYTILVENAEDIETAKDIAYEECSESASPEFTSVDIIKVKEVDLENVYDGQRSYSDILR